ncbi:protein lifeguard 1-like isoform X2 [Sitophilus oryzae]|uniref:Protein lifeguard 1-like isoform X2 n=1 Tax=Sitophilus oryzae TaxID=7048 RepID=A0A6J2YQA1_SITOR|nr:protein lifeguard 1-like isoform X2 [Sitophilus oryzae]
MPTATQPGFQPSTKGSDPYDNPGNPEDTGDVKGSDFTDQNNRRGFIRKVYSILMVQLLITFGFVTVFCFHVPTVMFLYSTFILFNMPGLFIIALVVMLVIMISLACWGEFIRKAPANYVMLFIFTMAGGVLVGVLARMYAPYAVWMAVGITAVVCLALTLFTLQTKCDFTTKKGILLVAVIILLVSASVASLLHSLITRKTYNTLLSVLTVNLVYASLGALVFSVYLIYDTQLMMGGKHKYSISPEEYVFAALNLYLDIIYIFPNLFKQSSKNKKKT